MSGHSRIATVLFGLAFALAPAAHGGTFEDGVSAHRRGDYVSAMSLWRQSAEQGNTLAQYDLGVMYANGEGVAQDYAEASRWYRLAAERGNVRAQSNLGVLYDKGQGVERNHAEAVKWFRLAAEQGNAPAQYNLALAYAKGQGIAQDYVEALKWFRLAEAGGYAGEAVFRGILEDGMSHADVAEAERRAESWKRARKK